MEFSLSILLLIGIQGSGKSTWAKANAARLSAEVLSSDAIRDELESQGRHADAANGDVVFAIFNARLERMLLDGKNVIADATHVRRVWRELAVRTARRRGAKIIGVWFDVPLTVCLQRNAARPGGPRDGWGDRVVPEEFLIEVAKGFEPPGEAEFDEVWKPLADQTNIGSFPEKRLPRIPSTNFQRINEGGRPQGFVYSLLHSLTEGIVARSSERARCRTIQLEFRLLTI